MNPFNTIGRWRIPPWFDAVVIATATVAIYAQVRGHSFIVFDDSLYVTGNQQVLGGLSWSSFYWAWSNFDAANYHPLTWLSYQLDIELFGPRPGWMALENVVWHALNGWLVARLLAALGCTRWGALFGALAFVAHPLNVESVAWISQRKTVLAAAFGFTAILVYLRRAQHGKRPVNWVVALTLVASLLSKAWFVVLPVLFLVLDFWPLRRLRVEGNMNTSITYHHRWIQFFRQTRPLLREKVTLFVLVAIVSAAAIASQHEQGAVVSTQSLPIGLRLQNGLVSTCAYLADTSGLGDFSVYYRLRSTFSFGQVVTAVGALGVMTTVCVTLRRHHATLLAAWLWFLIFLLPVIGLVQVGGQSRADRYMYLPLVGLLWATIYLAEQACFTIRSSLRVILVAPVLLWTAILGLVSHQQASLWRNSFGIVGHSIEVEGGGARLVSMLGTAHLQAGRWEAAIPLLERSLRDDPANSSVALNLALAYAKVGRTGEAMTLCDQVLKLEPDNYAATYNLSVFYHMTGDEERAQQFETRLKELHRGLGFFNAPSSLPPPR